MSDPAPSAAGDPATPRPPAECDRCGTSHKFGPCDPAARRPRSRPSMSEPRERYATTFDARWTAADAATAAATLRALADRVERGEVITHEVMRWSDRMGAIPCARYRVEILTTPPPEPAPVKTMHDTTLGLGLALNQDDAEHFAGWHRDRVFTLDSVKTLHGLIVRNVYLTELAAEQVKPEVIAYLRHVQARHHPHGVIRSLSGGLSWTPLA